MKKMEFKIALSAILVAMAFVLSYIKLPGLPYGGSVTLFSMVPVVIISCVFGPAWGLVMSFVYSLLQLVQSAGGSSFAGQNGGAVVLIILFDFVLAFGVLGLGGVFITKKNIAKKSAPFLAALGAFIVTLLRYVCHIISGYVLYGEYAEWFFEEGWGNAAGGWFLANFKGNQLSLIYSTVYNGLYMIPEIILTTVGVAVIMAVLMNVKSTKNSIVEVRSHSFFKKNKEEAA